jgi:hypothetical protein
VSQPLSFACSTHFRRRAGTADAAGASRADDAGGLGCDWQIAYLGYSRYDAVPTGGQLLSGASGNIMNVNDPKLTALIEATLHSNSPSAFDTYETSVAQQLPGQIDMSMRYGIEATANNRKYHRGVRRSVHRSRPGGLVLRQVISSAHPRRHLD